MRGLPGEYSEIFYKMGLIEITGRKSGFGEINQWIMAFYQMS